MKYTSSAAILFAGLWIHAQAHENSAPQAVNLASFDIRACFDVSNVPKIKEIDAELKATADEAAKKIEKAPEERERLRAEYLALYERRKLEIYYAIDKVCAALGKERGYTAIMKTEKLPEPVSTAGDSLALQIGRRQLMYSSPDIDITADVIKRLNEYLAIPKKNF
jgi:Skp family chaperone for outer membrane proteins